MTWSTNRDLINSRHELVRDAWLRSAWAELCAQALNERINEFASPRPDGSYPHAIYTEREDDWWHAKFVHFIADADQRDAFDEMARLFGTFLDDMRAALNYLAVGLARQALRDDPLLGDESLPWDERLHPEAVEFPIFDKPVKYRTKNKVGKLPDEYRQAIEVEQPCFGGNRDLWDLQTLAAEYRHRVIHPVAVVPVTQYFGVKVKGHPVENAEIVLHTDGSPLVHDDPVMSFRLPPNVVYERKEDVAPVVALQIGVDHPLGAGRSLTTIANGITWAVGPLLDRFESRFLGQPPSHDVPPVA